MIASLPSWLPASLTVSPWTATTFQELASVYDSTISKADLRLDGLRVWFFRDTDDGQEQMFWHLTHREDKQRAERLPDLPRCAKLSWFAAIIANADQPEVTRWDYLESDRSVNTYLWLRGQDCLVILRKYPDGSHRLITAYHVDTGTRRSLESKYNKRLA